MLQGALRGRGHAGTCTLSGHCLLLPGCPVNRSIRLPATPEALFPSPDDGGARSKKALGAMALGLGVAVRTHVGKEPVSSRNPAVLPHLPCTCSCIMLHLLP